MKKFNCGHAGKGTFCHRCDQAAKALDASKALETKDPERSKKLKAEAERLFIVPAKANAAPMMPSDPVPA
jgi:hypothetical protein